MTIQTFDFEGEPLRGTFINGEPWVVGKDVCVALGISNHNDALSGLPDDEKDGVGFTDPIGRMQTMTVVNEPGLYRLIFKSRKPEAERFKKWVFHDVLPAIRRTGSYDGKPTEARPIDDTMFIIPASKYIELLEFKISTLEEKAKPKPKRAARPPLTEDDYAVIRRLAAQGLSGQQIAKETGRSSGAISMALRICPIIPGEEGGAA